MNAAQALLRKLLDVAVSAADPARCVPALLPSRPRDRTVVFAFGKAAASMAAAVEAVWDAPLEGIAVTRYGNGLPLRNIRLIEAGHPHSDDAGADAAQAMLALAVTLGSDDLALALVSGGGSALTSLPANEITRDDKRSVMRQLLASGAPIDEINAVRRRLSAFKGGRLAAAAAPAHVHSILISDISGDDPALIASGPTFPSNDPPNHAREILARRAIVPPPPVVAFLCQKPSPVVLGPTSHGVAATAMTALVAAREHALAHGIECEIMSDRIEGEARVVDARHAAMASQRLGKTPLLLLSGGETSVTVTGSGRGGRNAEYLAALAIGIAGLPIAALAADTDGIDGSEDNAGAVADGSTLMRARAIGIEPSRLLANNDAWSLFAALNDPVITGPTRTNVNDFRAIFLGTE